MSGFEWVFAIFVFISGFIVVYHHVLFPLFLRWYSSKHKSVHGISPNTAHSITIIVPVYNEGAVIKDKVRNLACLIYPSDKLFIVICCDGCSDNTVELATEAAQEPECKNHNISIINYQNNRGKTAVLNEALQAVSTDIVCLTDASALMSVDALMRAASHFENKNVGVVAGTYYLNNLGTSGEDAYWQYQRNVKIGEAALGAPLGVHGACYFMRKEALHELPSDTINDDFILPMHAVINGYKAIYDPGIVGLETEPTNQNMNFKRRCRIAAGNVQQVMRMITLFHPRYGGIALAFASGKAARVAMPYLMIVCFFSSAVLAIDYVLFQVIFFTQLAGYAGAVLRMLGFREGQSRVLDILHYIVTGHCANLIGSLRYFIGLEKGRWTKVTPTENRRTSYDSP